MSDVLIEKNLNKARSLFINGKLIEGSNLLNSIINNFPHNQKVQFVIQQLKQSSLKQSNPSKEQIDILLKYYKNGELINAENLALSLTQEFPRHAFGWKVLGVILGDMGRKTEALNALQKALEIAPQDTRTHNNLGNILKSLGRFEEAELSFKQSIKLNPKSALAHNNLGTMLREIERFDEAKSSFEQAIRLDPELAVAYNNLGLIFVDLLRYDDAQTNYTQSLKLNPNLSQAYYNLGELFYTQGKATKHLKCFLNAISLDPDNISYRWNFANLQLLKVHSTHEDYKKSLQNFDHEITKLNSFITPKILDKTFEVVGTCFPYYLAYFENNNRYLLEKHGEICCRVMKNWQEKNLIPSINHSISSKKKGKIKVAIISSHIRYHSVWNHFLKGVIKNLNLDKFDLHVFSLNNKFDNETESIKKRVKYFYSGFESLNQCASEITNSKIDIAFYPEIGMDKLTIQLASMRLAPVQVTSFGHPETSGLNTIDYYVSSELLETSESKMFYTEKLIELPGLGYYFEPPTLELAEIKMNKFGINPNLPVILCLGAPNKFSPFYDWVYLEIIKRVNGCQLVFMDDRHGTSEILKIRLKNKIEQAGLNYKKHVIFIPELSREGYSALMNKADILLDPIGFSGANTTLHAIGCGLPVVTREGKFQRTKHASAILRSLKIEELITCTEEDYIDLVEKIILDNKFRKKLKSKIKSNEKILYKNKKPIRALENFFESVGRY
ncbi:tetratricopeptide repeat protein [Alphaproteobacteria bacterium]|nr:tetratricopeptide repeat protein [Alphaproteobacteria bacterium]